MYLIFVIFVSVLLRKLATKKAKIRILYERNTPPQVLAVLTNISYGHLSRPILSENVTDSTLLPVVQKKRRLLAE